MFTPKPHSLYALLARLTTTICHRIVVYSLAAAAFPV